jgi:Domain of unknown function (DUF222)/HNH endonuclease
MFATIDRTSSDPLDVLTAAIDTAVELDPVRLGDGELHDAVVALARLQARLEAAHCRLVRAWDNRQVWADNGSKSPAARLARETGMRRARATTLVRRGRQLAAMPATAAAYARGELSGDHVDVLAACTGDATVAAFAESEEVLVEACRTPWFENAVRTLEYWRQRVDPDGADALAAERFEHRHASISTGWRGEVVLDAVLDPLGGEEVMTALERIVDELRRHDRREGAVRTVRQRRADALVEMARRSATAPVGGLRPRPLLTVVLGPEPFARVCRTAHDTVVAPGSIVPLLSDADIERIVFDAPDRRFAASHRRTFVGALRRVIEVRDGHCQHPSGCDVPAHRCDVDHVVPWSRGGATTVANGQLLCATHNRLTKNGDARPPPSTVR